MRGLIRQPCYNQQFVSDVKAVQYPLNKGRDLWPVTNPR